MILRKTIVLLGLLMLLSGCAVPVKVKNPNNLTTEEIYDVLRHESIKSVWTSHSNHVGIELADGRTYKGVYNPHDILKFGNDRSLHPASNFVAHMRKKRLFSTWELVCE
jgi:hypothetical protein